MVGPLFDIELAVDRSRGDRSLRRPRGEGQATAVIGAHDEVAGVAGGTGAVDESGAGRDHRGARCSSPAPAGRAPHAETPGWGGCSRSSWATGTPRPGGRRGSRCHIRWTGPPAISPLGPLLVTANWPAGRERDAERVAQSVDPHRVARRRRGCRRGPTRRGCSAAPCPGHRTCPGPRGSRARRRGSRTACRRYRTPAGRPCGSSPPPEGSVMMILAARAHAAAVGPADRRRWWL